MKCVAVAVLTVLMTAVGPSRADAFFGIDFMEWLNDMSGPGPFHVFGGEATLACWGHLAKDPRSRKPRAKLPEASHRAFETAVRAALPLKDGESREETVTRLLAQAGFQDAVINFGPAPQLNALESTTGGAKVKMGRDAVLEGRTGLRKLKSLALTGSWAFACDRPGDDKSELVVDMHRSSVLLGVLVNYLFTPINHLQYEGRAIDEDTPNVHGVLSLVTADVEFARLWSVGVGAGAVVFKGGKFFKTFGEPAVQFRLGVRPLKHLDSHYAIREELLRPAPAAREELLTQYPVAGEALQDLADRIEAANAESTLTRQRILKKLSTLRFVVGYTWLPTSSRLNAGHFGAKPGSWAAMGDEHIITANFSWDISKSRTWRDHGDKDKPEIKSGERFAERAWY